MSVKNFPLIFLSVCSGLWPVKRQKTMLKCCYNKIIRDVYHMCYAMVIRYPCYILNDSGLEKPVASTHLAEFEVENFRIKFSVPVWDNEQRRQQRIALKRRFSMGVKTAADQFHLFSTLERVQEINASSSSSSLKGMLMMTSLDGGNDRGVFIRFSETLH